jgi:ribosomal protein S18 acetylase RimI-like enzyme
MHIRTYLEQDEPDVVALWKQVLPNDAPHNDPATSIRQKLAVDRELFLVAEVAGRIIGTAIGGYDGHRGWIYSVAVAQEHRHRGIGSMLVRQVEAALIARGCLKLNLQVRSTNASVLGFYEKLGFSVEPIISLGKRLYS